MPLPPRRRPVSSARVQARRLWFLLAALLREPACLPARLAFLLGASYLFIPLDLIPDRIPVIGHADEAMALLLGAIAAYRLMPAEILREAARRAASGLPSARIGALLAFGQRLHYRARRTGRHLWHPRPGRACRGGDLFGRLGYRWWWRLRAPLARRRPDGGAMIVIGGAARSGTTLLRHILTRHPMIASGGETTVFLARISDPPTLAARMGGAEAGWQAAEIAAWQRAARSQAEFIARFAAAIRARSGKPVWAEKTPRNIARFAFVRRHFPHARLVHIVRDGRDAVCSLRQTPFAKLDGADPAGIAAAKRCALQWRDAVAAGLAWRGHPACHTLHYEDLIAAPEATLRRLMAFLGLPWDEALLRTEVLASGDRDDILARGAIRDRSIGRWRRELSPQAEAAIAPLIAPFLAAYGYDAASRSRIAGKAATSSASAAAPLAMLRGP